MKNNLIIAAIFFTGGLFAQNLDVKSTNETSNETMGVNATVPRVTLIETFTSSTCPPCVPANQNYETLINKSANAGKFTGIKYQMNWPGSGDPYYTGEGGIRRGYYGISAVPYMLIDGGWNQNGNNLTQSVMDNYQQQASTATISAQYLVTGQKVEISVTVNAVEDLPGTAYRMYIAIVEGKTTQNVGSNGETEFFNVMKKMVPFSAGSFMGLLTKGQSYVKHYSYTFNGNYRLPSNANNPINPSIEHSVEDFNDLKVVVWIQENVSSKVEQSAYATISAIGLEENTLDNDIIIYPNPSSDLINIDVNAISNNNVEIQIVNTLGQVVFIKENVSLTTGANSLQLNVSHLKAGIHVVNIISENQVVTKTISIVK